MNLTVRLLLNIGLFILGTPFGAYAIESQSQCFRVEEDAVHLEQSQFVLCLSSADLERFPRSLVTVTFVKEELSDGRTPASESKKRQLLVKRYYKRFGPNTYGRSGHENAPRVEFKPTEKTVLLGFFGDQPKKYFYKRVDEPMVATNR